MCKINFIDYNNILIKNAFYKSINTMFVVSPSKFECEQANVFRK